MVGSRRINSLYNFPIRDVGVSDQCRGDSAVSNERCRKRYGPASSARYAGAYVLRDDDLWEFLHRALLEIAA
jgi:hypothetical protein